MARELTLAGFFVACSRELINKEIAPYPASSATPVMMK
ncbi:hypothetical protein ymoll0001_12670 [Yersinia mollaretii ATCC 43969]|uniref:Uncharacterized protein n=1 Tax=Yersinia mollaretii (strain ATCC 43969 / DSM 18520 / CIP 103324 / CNY 7263 / WAIP 204) TaxID=349967 RepID=A0ABP2EHX4_YERMW|nr:hypothetical protein ymoll0001_12670 [Yersinia mollaretii ATCC 43969]